MCSRILVTTSSSVAARAMYPHSHLTCRFMAVSSVASGGSLDYRLGSLLSTRIQLCGPYVVELEGRRVEPSLPGRQGRLLFAYLVLNRDRPIDRGELVDAIWSQEPPRDPADALAPLLSKVRTALSNRWLGGRSRITLMLPPHAEVDVERALAAVHLAQAARALPDWPRAR